MADSISLRTPREYPLELIIDTGCLGEGRHTTEVTFGGGSRLRVNFFVAGLDARVLGFESLGDDAADISGLGILQAKEKNDGRQPPASLPVGDKDWNARDMEGKWVLFKDMPE